MFLLILSLRTPPLPSVSTHFPFAVLIISVAPFLAAERSPCPPPPRATASSLCHVSSRPLSLALLSRCFLLGFLVSSFLSLPFRPVGSWRQAPAGSEPPTLAFHSCFGVAQCCSLASVSASPFSRVGFGSCGLCVDSGRGRRERRSRGGTIDFWDYDKVRIA